MKLLGRVLNRKDAIEIVLIILMKTHNKAANILNLTVKVNNIIKLYTFYNI